MLENLGMSFQGQQHSGIDDARNIARISLRMLEDGCDLKVNERLYAHKLKDIATLEADIQAVDCDTSQQDSSDSECDSTHAGDTCVERLCQRTSALYLPADVAEGIDDLLAYHKLQHS